MVGVHKNEKYDCLIPFCVLWFDRQYLVEGVVTGMLNCGELQIVQLVIIGAKVWSFFGGENEGIDNFLKHILSSSMETNEDSQSNEKSQEFEVLKKFHF